MIVSEWVSEWVSDCLGLRHMGEGQLPREIANKYNHDTNLHTCNKIKFDIF